MILRFARFLPLAFATCAQLLLVSAVATATTDPNDRTRLDYQSRLSVDPQFEIPSVIATLSELYPEADISVLEPSKPAEVRSISFAHQVEIPLSNYENFKKSGIRISILENDSANAFALPMRLAAESDSARQNAQIYLTTGLLLELQNESELAFVLAHEMSHIAHDHFAPDFPVSMLSAKQVAHISRVHQRWELEADREALLLLAKRGFETHAAVSLLSRLSSFEHVAHSSAIIPHPPLEKRIEKLMAYVEAEVRLSMELPQKYTRSD